MQQIIRTTKQIQWLKANSYQAIFTSDDGTLFGLMPITVEEGEIDNVVDADENLGYVVLPYKGKNISLLLNNVPAGSFITLRELPKPELPPVPPENHIPNHRLAALERLFGIQQVGEKK